MTTVMLSKTSALDASTPLSIKAQTDYQTKVIRSLEEFETCRKAWTELMNAADIQNLTMSHGWLVNWLKAFPALQLAVVVVIDKNGQWVAGAPLKISRLQKGVGHRALRHLHFIGTHPTIFDWMRIAISPQIEETIAADAMATALKAEPWDVMALVFNDAKSPLENLQQAFQKLSIQSQIEESMILPYIPLPETAEDYTQQRGKKTNTRVRHCYNRIKKQLDKTPELVFQPADAEKPLCDFIAGHTHYWGEQGFKSIFVRFPQLCQFYQDMLYYSQTEAAADDPKFVFTTLNIDNRPVSYHFGFMQGNGYLCHVTHYDDDYKFYSPGLVHMDKAIFNTIDNHGSRFEFGRGDEPYKKIWTQQHYPLWTMVAYKNPVARLLWQSDFAIKTLLKKPIGFLEP